MAVPTPAGSLLDRIDLPRAVIIADTLHWRQIPVAHQTRDRGHGRTERRTLKVATVAAGLAFLHAAEAIQIVRRRRPLTGENSTKWSTETAYAITSLTVIQAKADDLARFIRGHWGIEDRLHWVRDVTYDEDRSQVRTGNRPRVMASLHNLAIAILRLTGHTRIAAAPAPPRPPARPLRTITQC